MSPQDRLMLQIKMAEMMNKSYSQPMTATERVKGGASVLPVVGDAISGYDAYQSFKQGNYGEAALNAIGLLPMIPSLAGVIKMRGNIDNIQSLRKIIDRDGDYFVRWSAGPKYDLKDGMVSRDFISGNTHSGLSAVPLTKDMTDADLAKYAHEYSFLRMGSNFTRNKGLKIKAHVYSGKNIGIDSDGYPSIIPENYLGSLSDDFVRSMDDGLASKLRLTEQINDIEKRLNNFTGDSTGISILKDDLGKKRLSLANIISRER